MNDDNKNYHYKNNIDNDNIYKNNHNDYINKNAFNTMIKIILKML